MNKKGHSLIGIGILIIGLIIVFYPMMACIGTGAAPYDIKNVNACIFSSSFAVKFIVGSMIATIGAFVSNSNAP